MSKPIHYICLTLLIIVIPFICINGQERDFEKEFDDFARTSDNIYDDFRNKADEEFAGFLRKIWAEFEVFDEVTMPVRPEPTDPIVYDDKKPVADPVKIIPETTGETTEPDPDPGVYIPGKSYTPVKVEAPDVPDVKPTRGIPVKFYGTVFHVATNKTLDKLKLGGTSEEKVADAWTKVCKSDYEQLIRDCMTIREERSLNDWAYILFTRELGRQLFGDQQTDEIAFLQMFVLAKSGYKVKLAKVDESLKLLLAPACTLYGTPFIRIDGSKYYVFNAGEPRKGMAIYTYQQDFANSKNYVDLYIKSVPAFESNHTSRAVQSADKSITAQVNFNKNLIDFYRDYPQCDVDVYFKSPLSNELKDSFYPSLQAVLADKSQKEAANMLISFVQTAFEYMTDGDQFGYEKPFFYEENFFYPYNDCEDRAMLFATLVRDLMGLDVILLDYPDHIASAVSFTEKIEGDAVVFEDKEYIVCDPTYIGAPIGMSMDQYKYVSPAVIK